MKEHPGCKHTFSPQHIYDTLSCKTPLLSTDQCGVGVNNFKFAIDSLVYINIGFPREDGAAYTIH